MILLARALHPPCFRLLNFGPNPPPFLAAAAILRIPAPPKHGLSRKMMKKERKKSKKKNEAWQRVNHLIGSVEGGG